MRSRVVVHVISALVFFIGVSMLLPLLLALWDRGPDAGGIALATLVTLVAAVPTRC